MVHRLSFISRNPRYIIKIYIWMWFENFCLSSEYHFWYYHYYYMVEQHYWSLSWICVLDQSNISFSEVLKFCLFPVILSYLKFQHQESSSSPKIDTNAFGTVKLEACPQQSCELIAGSQRPDLLPVLSVTVPSDLKCANN